MTELKRLLKRKAEILGEITNLKEMRRGSVVEQFYESRNKDGSVVRRGPYYLYSYKEKGKTISRRLSGPASVKRLKREIEEFRKFEKLSSELISVNHKICEAKLEGEEFDEPSPQKKRLKRSSKKSPKRLKG